MDMYDNRLKEFLSGSRHPGLFLDTSAGLALGALPGLEDLRKAILPVLPGLEGLICSPGQLRRLASLTDSRTAVFVRVDWTNTLREADFPLPPSTPKHISILDPEDALEMGARGMVADLLLGYGEAIEAHCLKAAVQLALAGRELNLPLIVEVRPNGPQVLLRDKAIELGASFAQEAGADAISVPYPGPDSLKTIGAMLTGPWLLKPSSIKTGIAEWEAAEAQGAVGLWLDHTWLAAGIPFNDLIEPLRTLHRSTGKMDHEY
ncbi:MAG TPA: hypothetical protein VK249_23270 [Anaerolineales bacterium]|nr:hypothetical protein [Anaerolineales bacterium]